MSVVPMSNLQIDEAEETTKKSKNMAARRKGVYTETFLYDALYPLLMAMKLFGLHNTRHDKNCRLRFVTQIYGIVPGLIILSTLVRTLTLFNTTDGFGQALFGKLLNSSWLTWCLCGAISCSRAWFQEEKAPLFFMNFNEVLESCQIKRQCFKQHLRRRAIITTCISVVFVVANVILSGYLLLITNFLDDLKTPVSIFYSFPAWGQTLAICCLVVAQGYHTASWIFPITFGHCISLALRLELKCFNNAFSSEITDEGRFQGDLDIYRFRHQIVSRLIEKADDLLGFHISVNLIFPLAMLILLIISVLSDQSISTNTVYLVPYLYWIGVSSCFVGLVLYDGAFINDAAHASLSRLHDIKLQNLSNIRDLTELTAFLNKLSGPPIGVTALGLFVIDKPTILTTIGMFLTYFVIVVQFRTPTSSGAASGNATLIT
ncbi:uncharacterized protein LOC135500481 [Lineus longissimus]|uniref:uncharacterized protein LOC135500481 n=1 Tax=Lineus longissimus TaxID=88925 RepID=UPI002B4D6BD9